MAALKELLNPASVRIIGAALAAAHPALEEKEFVRAATAGLRSLELKGRVQHIARTMRKFLPENYSACLPILVAAVKSDTNPEGLDGFAAWPITYFIEEFGVDQPAPSLAALAKITPASSGEFAVRPFLDRHPTETLALMTKWARSKDHHVRRLASEGTRPRLPWGSRLRRLQANPELAAPILRALRQDPELYVRKSVANHLNDFSKDHPDWLIEELRRWKEECPGDANVAWILNRALRTLVKAGHRDTLALLGFGNAKFSEAKLTVNPRRIRLGGALALSFSAVAKQSGRWVVDYAVHHQKQNGGTTPKVFKWKALDVRTGDRVALTKKHSIKQITTRKYYSGAHAIEVFVNGKSAGKVRFNLTV